MAEINGGPVTCVYRNECRPCRLYSFPRRHSMYVCARNLAHTCVVVVLVAEWLAGTRGDKTCKRQTKKPRRKNANIKSLFPVVVCCTSCILLLFLFEGQRRVDVIIKYACVFRRVIDRVKSPLLLFRFGALLEGILIVNVYVCTSIFIFFIYD